MFIRLIFTGLIFYLGYRFVKSLMKKGPHQEEIKGKNKNQPLDLKKSDVTDARFEDIEDGK